MKQNNYKKGFLVLALSFFAVTGAFAQISLGLDLNFPTGNLSNSSGIGFGFSGRYDGAINDNLSWTAGIGYISFTGKSYTDYLGNSYNYGSFGVLPIQGGVKYYFTESNAGFYGAADIGIWFGTAANSGSEFGFSPGVGYRMGSFDFAFRYNAVGNISNVGLRAAYVLGAD